MKLVRDKIPELFPENGYAVASADAQHDWLIRKLVEETAEVMMADDIQGELEELADVLEVVRALVYELGSTMDDVDQLRDLKYRQRGGYAHGKLLVALAE